MLIEGKTVELKREYVDDIKKTAAAFANCDGGTVYIGIDDDGSVCGVIIKLGNAAPLPFALEDLTYHFAGLTTTDVLRGIGVY